MHRAQDGLRDWIEESGYKFPGFASARRNPLQEYPPNSPDCVLLDAVVFWRFKVLFAVATRIIEDLGETRKHGCSTWMTLTKCQWRRYFMDDASGGEQD
jgi:hypothetical protein